MTLHEIMVLNRGIDNARIVGVAEGAPLDIAKDNELILETKRQLVQKGILESYDSFTTKGALIFSRLLDYKKAEKYICIQGVWMGIMDKKKSVIIQKKGADSYHLETIDTDSIENYIHQKYRFLQNNHKPAESIETQITERQIYQMYYLESKEGFLFDCVENKNISIPGVRNKFMKRNGILYFQHKDKEYRYDINQGLLRQVTGEMIQSEIQQKMRVGN